MSDESTSTGEQQRDVSLLVDPPHRDELIELAALANASTIPGAQKLKNMTLFMPQECFQQIVIMYRLLNLVLTVPGDLYEFGCRWGRNVATLSRLHYVLESRHLMRRVIAFDSFEGLVSVDPDFDGLGSRTQPGRYATTEGYEEELGDICKAGGLKVTIAKGDVCITAQDYFNRMPSATVALAYFDLDIYKPTKAALEAVLPRCVSGSVLAFDEYAMHYFPGETIAAREVLGCARIQRWPDIPHVAYHVIE